MTKGKIAVLLSSYNGEKYLKQQVDSILNQSVENEVHLFIRDDGSKDNTVNLVQELMKTETRISLIAEKNIGGVGSFFALLKMAHSLPEEYSYFALSDQDDVWDLDKLKIGVESIESVALDIPVLYGSITRPVNKDLEPIEYKKKEFRPFHFYNTIIQNKIPGHTHVMNRALLNLVYDADPLRVYVHDAFIVNAANIAGILIFDNAPHVSYRQHGGNQLGTSRNSRIKWIQNRLKRLKKGDGVQYARQIEYVVEQFGDQMTQEQQKEMREFLDSRCSFWKRLNYVLHTKLYRQDDFDTFAFKLMYLFGGYNTNN